MTFPSIVWRGVATHAQWPSFGALAQTCRGAAAGASPLTIEKIALAHINLTSLCLILGGYSIDEDRLARVLRFAAADMLFMNWQQFEELVKVQLCLQRFRSIHGGHVTLRDVCTLFLRSLSPTLLMQHDVCTELLAWLTVAPQLLSKRVDSSIGELQNRWRRFLVDRCCIGSVVQLLLLPSLQELAASAFPISDDELQEALAVSGVSDGGSHQCLQATGIGSFGLVAEKVRSGS